MEDGSWKPFNQSFELEVGPPVEDGIVTGLVFGYDECSFFTPNEPDQSFDMRNVTAVLEWDDSDGVLMDMDAISAGRNIANKPNGSSPLEFQVPDVGVRWDAYLAIRANAQHPPGELRRPASMQVTFEYLGHEPWARTANC